MHASPQSILIPRRQCAMLCDCVLCIVCAHTDEVKTENIKHINHEEVFESMSKIQNGGHRHPA